MRLLYCPLLDGSTHPEVGTLIVAVSRKMAVCTCQPAVVREEPRGESTLRELVLSSSFGDTLSVFALSGVLRSRFFLQDPLPLKGGRWTVGQVPLGRQTGAKQAPNTFLRFAASPAPDVPVPPYHLPSQGPAHP